MQINNYNNIIINILTRTSKRPSGFNRCYTSIKKQTYSYIKHIVSYDNPEDLVYLKNLDIELLDVSKLSDKFIAYNTDHEGNLYAPYNLYCNALLDKVNEGWIIFLDDDDHLYHNNVIKEIVKLIQSNYSQDRLFIWQMRYPNGRILPSNELIDKQLILKNNIGSPCFVFHSKYKDEVKWDAFKAADFRFLEQLNTLIPNKVWLQKIGVQINNYGDLGKKTDIHIRKKGKSIMPSVFYKNILWYFIPKYHMKICGFYVFQKKSYRKCWQRFEKYVTFSN